MSTVMDTSNTVDLSVCVDCLFLLANGEVQDGEGNDITQEHAHKVRMLWSDTEITLGSLECRYCPTEENGDCESWFSYLPCNCCGSSLGGDRSHATAWVD